MEKLPGCISLKQIYKWIVCVLSIQNTHKGILKEDCNRAGWMLYEWDEIRFVRVVSKYIHYTIYCIVCAIQLKRESHNFIDNTEKN